MLDALRRRKRSWIIIFLIGIIVFVFVLWGVGSYVDDQRIDSVAEVNGEAISPREFELHYQRTIDLYRDLFRGALTREMIRGLNLRRALLDELIQGRLLLQEARRLGIQVSDEELMDAIARVPDFQVNGLFDRNRYLQVLRLNRLTPAQFELEQRRQLTIRKLYDIIQDSVHVTEAEVRERYRLGQERINLAFIRLSTKEFEPEVKVTPEEVKNYHERNRDALREPLKVQVEYVEYPWDHFGSAASFSEKEIEEFYQRHLATRFREPKAVRLRQIFFRVPMGAGPEKEKIRMNAEAVLGEVRAGKDFAEIAKERSEDPSAAQGGDIGWFVQGQMLPALDQAAFALKRGQVSNLLETSLGYHILKVEEIKEGRTKSLKEARQEIIGSLRAEQGRNEAGKAVDADRARAVLGGDLSLLAKERGIPFKVSPLFSPGELLPEVGPVEEFYRTALSLAVKEVSPAIEGSRAYYLLRVRERKEPSVPSLEAARPEIEKTLTEMRALELATQRANALLTELKKHKDIGRLAREHGLRLEETGWFARSDAPIPKVGTLQEVAPGGIPVSRQKPVPDRIYTQTGAVYLFAFKESRGADMERFEKERASIEEQLLMEKRRIAVQRFIDSLMARARIEVKTQFLEEG